MFFFSFITNRHVTCGYIIYSLDNVKMRLQSYIFFTLRRFIPCLNTIPCPFGCLVVFYQRRKTIRSISTMENIFLLKNWIKKSHLRQRTCKKKNKTLGALLLLTLGNLTPHSPLTAAFQDQEDFKPTFFITSLLCQAINGSYRA